MSNKPIIAASTFTACLALAIGWIPDGMWVQQGFMFLSGFMACIAVWLCVEE